MKTNYHEGFNVIITRDGDKFFGMKMYDEPSGIFKKIFADGSV